MDSKGRTPVDLFETKSVGEKNHDCVNFLRLYFASELKKRSSELDELRITSAEKDQKITKLEEQTKEVLKENEDVEEKINEEDEKQKSETIEQEGRQYSAEKRSEHVNEEDIASTTSSNENGICNNLKSCLKKEKSEMGNSIDQSEKELIDGNQQSIKIETEELENCENKITMNEQMKKAEESGMNMKSVLDEHVQKCESLEVDNNKLQLEIEELRAQNSSAQEKIEKNASIVEELVSLITNVQVGSKIDNSSLKETITELETRLKESHDHSEDLVAKVEDMEKINSAKSSLEEKVLNLNIELSAFKMKTYELIQQSEGMKMLYEKKLCEVETELSITLKTATDMAEMVKELQDREDEMNEQMDEFEKSDQYHLDTIENLNSDYHEAMDQKVFLEKRLKLIVEKLESTSLNLEETEKTRDELESKLKKMDTTEKALKEHVRILEDENQHYQNEIETLNKKINDQNPKYEIMKLNSKISSLSAENEKMEKKIISLEKALYEYHRLHGNKQNSQSVERRQSVSFDGSRRGDFRNHSAMKRDEPEPCENGSLVSPKKVVFTSNGSSSASSEKTIILNKIKNLGKIMNEN